jgi:putative cell wall-binding protein
MPIPSRCLAVIALTLAVAVAGCGKTLPGGGQNGASMTAIAPVSPRGAGAVATKNTTRLGGADVATDAAAVAVAVHPGLTAASRPQAVVVVDEREWPAALAAAALAGAPLQAPLLYSNGEGLGQVSEEALKTMQPAGAAALGGAQVIAVGRAAVPTGWRVQRVSGGDPYALAAALARLLAAVQSREPRQVVVAAADGPPALAMPAAGLAAESGVPILLVSGTGVVPAAVKAALGRWHKPSIYVVGSTASVSSPVVRQLEHYGLVKRISSPVGRIEPNDPVGNAIGVALFSEGGFGWGVAESGHGLVFANATRPLDAPAAAPLSASGQYGPLLLLEGPDGVPRVLSEYLKDIQPGYSEAPQYRPVHGAYNHGWLIGDESAIGAATQAELDGMLEIAPSSSSSTSTTSSVSSTATTTK